MQISSESKFTTAVTITAGATCGYFAPAYWLTGFGLGFLSSKLGDNNPPPSSSTWAPYYTIAVLQERALPGRMTASLNLISCYVLVSKIALPLILGVSTTPLLVGASGLFLGYTLQQYFQLDRLNLFAKQKGQEMVLSSLEKIVL